MLGILVQLIISAALLWFVEKQSLAALGPFPALVRPRQFIFGFIVSAALCIVAQLFIHPFNLETQYFF
jgi:multisubunit Na+/H+ antiporter MnhE subunit